ncbi:hypothetical protein MLD38_032929 [Melastoma candidum]|uniref:Uncharacterized protein n=1 Tax=Melastoma candidum TaxID=119954 RepID=A0ACB9M562_9MYRT|nr:hypothetical protein MLD38_032929 [Melastoma candidum]
MSSCGGIHSYGLLDLIGGFVYLAVAYVMLWIAAWVYVVSRFLGVIGLFLPCPCEGILGFRSNDLCLRRILVDFPLRNMFYVRSLVERILVMGESRGGLLVASLGTGSCGREIMELGAEGEGCSGSKARDSGRKGGGGFDVKGKSPENSKHWYGLRRRKKGGLRYGKVRPLNLGNPESGNSSAYNNIEKVSEVSQTPESFSHAGVMEYHLLDSKKASIGDNLGEKAWDSYELSETFNGSNVLSGGETSSVENVFVGSLDNLCCDEDANRRIRTLEQALAEEKARRAALYRELEEERAAAATAADEAMAMMFRLQEEKAMIEMEVRQSQRMIEEKAAYDEEEMNILKEILIRRERESFFLENELQAYKLASSSDESIDDISKHTADVLRRRPSSLIHPDEEDKNRASRARHLQTSEDEVEAVYDVHVVDDTTGHGSGGAEESKQENRNSCKDERQQLDREVEWLTETRRIVQEGKEKLRSSGKSKDSSRSTTQVNLWEDIGSQLREIEGTTGPSGR